MKHQPPRLAKSVLRRLCHVSFIEEVEGDLDEQFFENVETRGLFRARTMYWVDVLRAISSGNRKGRQAELSGISLKDSLSHFFKIFFRSMRHGVSSAVINVVGLVLSFVSFIAIWLYVNDEISYDKFHPDAENIYRISHSYSRLGDGSRETDARLPGLWVEELNEKTPLVAYTRYSKFGYPGSVSYPKTDKLFEEPQVFWVDSTYTDFFSLEIVRGSEASVALQDPSKVIISESSALKYFGDADPVGEEIVYARAGMNFPLIVAGVMKDYPLNAHFHPAFIISNRALAPLWKRDGADRVNSYGDPFTYSFIKLDDERDLSRVATAMEPIVREHSNESVKAVFTPLTDIHFTNGMLVELESAGDRSYVYISASIGILILIIAAINYMNLATARSVRRSKEVGLRKTLGVRRASLMWQFLGESMTMMLISFILAIAVTGLLLPFFNVITGKAFTFASLLENNTLIIVSLVVVALAILSGSYPAFYLSRFKPADVLKGTITKGSGAENFRLVLVVFQFSITVMLIICATIIHNQLSFIQVGKLASHADQVITIRTGGDVTEFRNLLMQDKNILEVSFSGHLPIQATFGFMTQEALVKSRPGDKYMIDLLRADEYFVSMFDLDIVAGRNFSYSIAADTNNFIINESAAKQLQFTPQEAIGQEIGMRWAFEEGIPAFGKIVGVVKDFPYASVREKISPLVLSGWHQRTETMNVKLAAGNVNETIASIEQTWKKMYGGYAFQYWFMDQEFERLYRHEKKMARLSNYFTVFTIVIACLGLFGLASFTAEQKTKEIGIRKVLGATAGQILLLLTNRFVRLVVIACVVAMPLSLYAMSIWLENFAYRTTINWLVFAGAGVFILVLTYVTVGLESLRAANANPVNSIRHE